MGVAEEMCGRGQINFPADLPLVEDCQFQGLDPPLPNMVIVHEVQAKV